MMFIVRAFKIQSGCLSALIGVGVVEFRGAPKNGGYYVLCT